MRQVLLFGAVWVAALAVLAFALGRTSGQRPRVSTAERVALSPPPPPPRAGTRYPGWTVTRAYSAHQTMVVEVETERPANARQIATQVVEPLRERYDEVLIYIRMPDRPADELPARRIQWTPRGGYVESVYSR